jgi:hypothetical protein
MDGKYELLVSIAHGSRPLRWKLRKTFQKEKENLEKEYKRLEELGVSEDVLKSNKKMVNLLEELTETFRPAIIHKQPLDELKTKNKKVVKEIKK